MKIVFVAPFGLGHKTTVWARILPLARYLVRRGAEVHLLIPPWDTPSDAGKSWMDEGVHLQNVSLGGALPGVTLHLLLALHALKPDIVHIIKPRAYAGIIQWLLWQWRAITLRAAIRQPSKEIKGGTRSFPAIYLDIDDWEQAWNEISGFHPLLSRFLKWQEEWGIRHADGITAASRWLAERAEQYTPETPILYLPNGVTVPPHSQQDEALPFHPNQILYFTRFVEVDAGWLARFWGELYAQVPDAQLVIAGDALQPGKGESFRHEFEANLQTDRAATSSVIQWLGLVNQEKIHELYATSACAIFPSMNVPLQQAKCSVRLATTLLHGVPVVASAVGQQSEYGANGAARLVPASGTPEEFATQVAILLGAPTNRKTLQRQAQKHLLNHFNWSTLGTSLFDFYK